MPVSSPASTGILAEFSVVLDAAAGREGRKVEWYASEFNGFRHGYAGTIYKGQGKTLDHTYLLHTHHWRAASSYVALTRQRESATIFVATETARDLRQLARQIGRNEIKSASVAYATWDELSAEQKSRLGGERAAEGAQTSKIGREGEGLRDGTRPVIEGVRWQADSDQSHDAGRSSMDADVLAQDGNRRAERVSRQGAKGRFAPSFPEKERSALLQQPVPGERFVTDETGARYPAKTGEGERPESGDRDRPAENTRVLVAAFRAVGSDGIQRDSLGRVLDERSFIAAIDRDPDVQRERDARSIYLETAYRNPKSARQRLNEFIARDGATSAAQRITADAGLLGDLRGRTGLLAGAKARDERQAAERAAAAIGPNVVQTAEFEKRAAQSYRTDVENQMKADAVEVVDVSSSVKAVLEKIAMAKNDRERVEAFKAMSTNPDISQEVNRFKTSVKARFGEEGVREMHRSLASGKTFEHPTAPKSEQAGLNETARLYSVVRSGEAAYRQHVETERIEARELQSARLKQ